MLTAGPSCGSHRGCTATRRTTAGVPSAAWWRWTRTRMNGGRRSRCSRPDPARREDGLRPWPCGTGGGCLSWRSPRSRRSGRGGGARACPDGPVGAAGTRVRAWRAERGRADPARGGFRRGGDGGMLARASGPPTVMLVFGVNDVGKTTAVAKLGARLARGGRSVLLAAADTFRAGAAEQLEVWADRLGVPCVTGTGDPAAVAFDAIAAARARGADTVLVDTAGRLHTEDRLLEELKKVVRVVAKQQPGAPHESLLVLDGTVGQNAVHQARAFAAAVPLSGLVVTKLDGTAKGGSVVALQRAVRVPVRFLGTGEGLEDLEVFDAARYAHRIVSG